MSATDVNDTGIEFVDELPKIERSVESGVWVKRLEPLRDNPGRWAKVYGPTNSPHALVNNLRSGNAAGINADEYQFAGRTQATGRTVEQPVKGDPAEGDDVDENGYLLDEDGNVVTEEVAEKEGFVFAKFLTDAERAERDAKRAEAEVDATEAADVVEDAEEGELV